MPELPEVEVLRRSLEPHVVGSTIDEVRVWRADLREPVDRRKLARRCRGRQIHGVRRRAKYLLLDLEHASTLILHLGMSGRLTLVSLDAERDPHEHVAFVLDSGRRLRFRDPRRFGLVFVQRSDLLEEDRHFEHLGLEPLGDRLCGDSLRQLARGRRAAVKSFLMDNRLVVGLGNIYAAEALFRAGVHPARTVARISAARWQRLADGIRTTLQDAIAQGGTTLNDFANAVGERGYFRVSLAVYGREGEPCRRCRSRIRRVVQTGRSTFYCPGCQR